MNDVLERNRQYQKRIREILLCESGTIEVGSEPEGSDEYGAYVSQVTQLLMRKIKRAEIFDYLWWVETEYMGLIGDRPLEAKVADIFIKFLTFRSDLAFFFIK